MVRWEIERDRFFRDVAQGDLDLELSDLGKLDWLLGELQFKEQSSQSRIFIAWHRAGVKRMEHPGEPTAPFLGRRLGGRVLGCDGTAGEEDREEDWSEGGAPHEPVITKRGKRCQGLLIAGALSF